MPSKLQPSELVFASLSFRLSNLKVLCRRYLSIFAKLCFVGIMLPFAGLLGDHRVKTGLKSALWSHKELRGGVLKENISDDNYLRSKGSYSAISIKQHFLC